MTSMYPDTSRMLAEDVEVGQQMVVGNEMLFVVDVRHTDSGVWIETSSDPSCYGSSQFYLRGSAVRCLPAPDLAASGPGI